MQAGVDTVKRLQSVFIGTLLIVLSVCTSVVWAEEGRWPERKANAWYAQQPWLVGSNYVPKSAINQLEMWQETTFDRDQIDKELGWAEAMGMNTMRVFLHDLLWQQDAAGFQKRIDQFLTIASRHHIRLCWCFSTHAGIRCLIWGRSTRQLPEFTTQAGCRVRARRRSRTAINIRG